ncbi:hypothetical protein A9R00_11135 [Oleispira antarctica]|uniref:PilZ domain-containing protein n=1 Tax=Oleispira antarctica TaxID=188908 RepID=A0A1Y5HNE4_OLEAN|nr:hypothetical protein A9R00_11135 [Oleispira antarctica]
MSSTSRDYSEKRDFIRMQVSTNCQILYKGEQFAANCLDLSSKGALIESSHALEASSEITLIIESGGGDIPPLHAQATVLRIVRHAEDNYQYGVSIDHYL